MPDSPHDLAFPYIDVSAELVLERGPLGDPDSGDGTVSLIVVSMTGQEAASELFSFDVVVLVDPAAFARAHDAGGLDEALLLHPVSFRLGPGGDRRYGIVSEVRNEGPVVFDTRTFARLRVRVAPRAWILTQRRNSRIFQHLYLHEIVGAVLSESGVPHRWDLSNQHRRRVYCTQYEETDYDFMRRLFAEEGVLFFFEFHEDFKPPESADKDQSLSDLEHAQRALKVGQAASKELSGIAKTAGSEEMQGVADLAGAGMGMAGDLLRQNQDDEDDAPKVIGHGSAGPRGPGDVLVFIDHAFGYAASTSRGGDSRLELTLRDEAGMRGDPEQLEELTPGFRSAPRHVELRDYDFRRPLLLMQAREGGELDRERQPGLPREMYDHHGEYTTHATDGEGARLHLEQHRRDAALAHGRGRSSRICAGHTFSLTVHVGGPRETLAPEGHYAVVSARHEYYNVAFANRGSGDLEGVIRGCAGAIREAMVSGLDLPPEELEKRIRAELGGPQPGAASYRNRFSVVAADRAYRPPRPARALRHATETATVVGPPGKDIHLDRHGRVKVQFHWDREGRFNANSSCWLRVSQPWAGAGYGFQFFPRVGMEVLVTFLGGDTDRPVVVGALYNATHATPEPLPERSTRSGIRTQSSPQGGGFNELGFEDARGAERIYLHAERNLEAEVNFDHDLSVGNRSRVSVGGDQETGVTGNQRTAVGANRSTSVGGSESAHVGGNQSTRVVLNRSTTVEGSTTERVSGGAVSRTDGSELSVIGTSKDVTAGGGIFASAEWLGGTAGLGAGLTAGELIVLRTQKTEDPAVIRLECGESVIEIRPDRIAIESKQISIRAREQLDLFGRESRIGMKNAVVVEAGDGFDAANTSRSAGLFFNDIGQTCLWGTQTDVQGQSVSFGQPPAPDAPVTRGPERETDPDPNLTLRFTHLAAEDDRPLSDTRYRFTYGSEDGQRVYEGRTDGDGTLKVYFPDEATAPMVTLWAHEKYPDIYTQARGLLHFALRPHTSLPAEDSLARTRLRLRNLGYAPGRGEALDPESREALRQFQRDRELPVTGEADERTRTKLKDVYGS